MLTLQPITFREACEFVQQHHRHHQSPVGWLFGCAANDGERVVGVVMVGRPVSRHLDNGYTAEVTRCCVLEGVKNGCSLLYAAAWRAARALGYKRLITYVLASERGDSLKASGWRLVGQTAGGSWSRPSRPRVDKAPTEAKSLWDCGT
jgi:hypothetical protein